MTIIKKSVIALATVSAMILTTSTCLQARTPKLGKDSIDKVVKAMTLEEKVKLLFGTGMDFEYNPNPQGILAQKVIVRGQSTASQPIERLGIPSIVFCDGPAGLHIDATYEGAPQTYYCTGFPVATCLASSWNRDLVSSVGKAMGNEVLEYNADVLLAPALNIQRNPLCGRNFEYYSEDPLLSGTIAASMISGIQSNGVGTSVKHFIAGGKETNSNNNDARVSQRALREIYLKGFEIAVKQSNPWTIMTSYNLVNGIYTSENPELLQSIVRDEWKYDGTIITDWWAGKHPIEQVKAGNDMILPGRDNQYEEVLEAAKNGLIPISDIDRNVKNVLSLIEKSPKFKGYKPSFSPDLTAHAEITRQSASEGMVLLENKNETLPIKSSIKNIALFGNTSYEFIAGGTGSGDVNKAYVVDLETGLKNAGYSIDQTIGSVYRNYITRERASEEHRHWFFGKKHLKEVAVSEEDLKKSAQESDMAIITIGRISGEGGDRKIDNDFNLSTAEKALIKSVTEAFHNKGKKAVVILNIGGVVETASWKNIPDAVLLAWQPGQEGGNSVADILSGKVNPSGRLAVTFPTDYFDEPAALDFPYANETDTANPYMQEVVLDKDSTKTATPQDSDKPVRNFNFVEYEEDIYVGYRFFDRFNEGNANQKVSYPFGYGLSYTTFDYSKPTVESDGKTVTVSVKVTNTGKVEGKEVVQLYVAAPKGKLDKPVKELRAYTKTDSLKPGESQKVTMTFDIDDLASFDESKSAWSLDKGTYRIIIAKNSSKTISTTDLEVSNESLRSCNNVLKPQYKINKIYEQ